MKANDLTAVRVAYDPKDPADDVIYITEQIAEELHLEWHNPSHNEILFSNVDGLATAEDLFNYVIEYSNAESLRIVTITYRFNNRFR